MKTDYVHGDDEAFSFRPRLDRKVEVLQLTPPMHESPALALHLAASIISESRVNTFPNLPPSVRSAAPDPLNLTESDSTV